jgi:hypothetical protein
MSGTKYHSWETKIDGKRIAIGVSEIPDRKTPCLYVMEGTILFPLAYFRSESRAKKFLEILDSFIKIAGRWTSDEGN